MAIIDTKVAFEGHKFSGLFVGHWTDSSSCMRMPTCGMDSPCTGADEWMETRYFALENEQTEFFGVICNLSSLDASRNTSIGLECQQGGRSGATPSRAIFRLLDSFETLLPSEKSFKPQRTSCETLGNHRGSFSVWRVIMFPR